ncbi:MAG: LuxR C-terminal-related transcriptional regulator [Rikenellaceae bacterium]|nr:LuxR C-terminal-related transcriptional regulator [Rikenellaceae bacterium]
MGRIENTREEMWKMQGIDSDDVDYESWEYKRNSLREAAKITSGCIFTVDVYKGVYDFASGSFHDIFGIPPGLLATIEQQGDLIEERIHPGDRYKLIEFQIRHSYFIYSLPSEERNDYRTIYQFRMRDSQNKYINVISRQQVIEKDRKGKAWIIMGILEILPDQSPVDDIKHSVMNLKNGCFIDPYNTENKRVLTGRVLEIISLIRRGYLSKEIACKLGISIYTVNNHRKSILAKLEADNSIEAINNAKAAGLIY